jgi:hypothetical protein
VRDNDDPAAREGRAAGPSGRGGRATIVAQSDPVPQPRAPGTGIPAGPRAPVYRNFILDTQRRFIFAYVPKVACTNWKCVMRRLAGHDDWLDSRLAHDETAGGLHYLALPGPERDLLQDPSIPKYAMVRNPYARVLSAYLNKVESRLPPGSLPPGDHFDRIVQDIESFRQRMLDPRTYPAVDFEVFLLWLQDGTSPFTRDEHWARQSAILRLGKVDYAFLGRFERMAEDAPRLMALMGADFAFPTQADVQFQSQGTAAKLDSYLTPALGP